MIGRERKRIIIFPARPTLLARLEFPVSEQRFAVNSVRYPMPMILRIEEKRVGDKFALSISPLKTSRMLEM